MTTYEERQVAVEGEAPAAPAARLPENVLRRLFLSKFYLANAEENLRFGRDVTAFLATNLLHEAVECFLLAATDYLHVVVSEKASLIDMFDAVGTKMGTTLPSRFRLSELSRVRTAVKHSAVPPDRPFLARLGPQIRELIVNGTAAVFGHNYEAVSLIDALNDDDIKVHLLEAERHALADHRFDALVCVRRALFVAYEAGADLRPFADADPQTAAGGIFGLLMGGMRAPSFARNHHYVKQNVRCPFDYIQLDHGALDASLLKDGIQPSLFWNLWRNTPRVYLQDDEWLVEMKPQFDEIEPTDVYFALDSCVELMILRQSAAARNRFNRGQRSWYVETRDGDVSIFISADTGSESTLLPEDVRRLDANAYIRGLDGNYFYAVSDFGRGRILSGYLREDDIRAIDEPSLETYVEGGRAAPPATSVDSALEDGGTGVEA